MQGSNIFRFPPLEHYGLFSPTAFFVFFPGTAGTGIIGILFLHPLHWLIHISVLVGLLLFLTIAGLVRTLCPLKQPGRVIKHLRQYGLYMAPVFAALFAVFLVLFRIIEHKASLLRNTSELYPVREIITYNKFAIAASLSLLAAVISLVSGIIGIIKKKRNKAETS